MNRCPLCDRELGEVNISRHHLIPKLKGGKMRDAEAIHEVCHRKIHSVFTECELKNFYHTWDRLKEHSEISTFVKWVQKRPIDYIDSSKQHSRKR